MNNLKIYKKIKCELTAEEWGLYTATYPAETRHVAIALNYTIEQVVNSGGSKQDAEQAMELQMVENAKYGANDSETYAMLAFILMKIYN